MSQQSPLTLPVIDFAQLTASAQQRSALLDSLARAAREVGFFFLINHGINQPLID